MLLAVVPDIFDRIEFGRIGWQGLHLNGPVLRGDKLSHQPAAMNGQAVPNGGQPATDMPLKMFQELDDLRGFDAAAKKPGIDVSDRDPGHSRQTLPIERILQHRSLATRSPSAYPVWTLAQTALVHKHYGLTLLERFFYSRPAHPFPPLDGRFIALGGPPHWALAASAQGTQNSPNISRMILLPSLSVHQIGHTLGRPQRSVVAQGFRTFLQDLAQFLQLDRLQTRFTASACRFAQRLGSVLFSSLMPPADRLAMHAQSSGDLALMEPSVKELGGLESRLFQFIKIAFNAFWISHARSLTLRTSPVAILCEMQ